MANDTASNHHPQLAKTTFPKGRLSESEIRHLVNSFYTKVRSDPELGPIFERAVGDWGQHLARMHDFWSSIMLTSGRYHGNPVTVHLRVAGMEPLLFARWLALFNETCRDLFEADIADAFLAKAERIAESLKLALFNRPDRRWKGVAP
jgi:hemoglobin